MPEIVRLCITCRQPFPRTDLIRLTCQKAPLGPLPPGGPPPPEAAVSPAFPRFAIDNNPPLQGRSAYVCRNRRCLAEALKGKKFQRTLKRAIPDDILRTLNAQLEGMDSE